MTLYTSCPIDYDGFGTHSVRVVGVDSSGRDVRKVEIMTRHLDWQRNRYYSGGIYLVVNQDDLDKLVAHKLIKVTEDEC